MHYEVKSLPCQILPWASQAAAMAVLAPSHTS